MACKYCNQPVVLIPSAAERARRDTSGHPAAYYTALFPDHAQCVIDARSQSARRLMQP